MVEGDFKQQSLVPRREAADGASISDDNAASVRERERLPDEMTVGVMVYLRPDEGVG